MRQTQPVLRPLEPEAVLQPCLLGVPYGYDWLIGRTVYFLPDKGGKFPMTVVDVENKYHQPHMKRNYLAGDTNCRHLVHQRGVIALPESRR